MRRHPTWAFCVDGVAVLDGTVVVTLKASRLVEEADALDFAPELEKLQQRYQSQASSEPTRYCRPGSGAFSISPRAVHRGSSPRQNR